MPSSHLRPRALAWLAGAGLAAAAWAPIQVRGGTSPSPAPSDAARPGSPAPIQERGGTSPSPRPEEIPESYRKVLAGLRDRKEETAPPGELRLGRPASAASEVASASTVKVSKSGPLPTIRAIRQIEGEWVVFFEGERRPIYPGDFARGVKVLAIAEDGVTVEASGVKTKIAAKVVRPPFPELAFNGVIDMGSGRVVMMAGRRNPVRPGDVINGAKIVEIQKDKVVVEYEGERRSLPVK